MRTGKRGPWKRRQAIDDMADRERKEPTRPKPWREVLQADLRDPDSMPYGDCWARLISLRYTYDDAGTALVDPEQFDEIRKAAESWDVKHPGSRSDTVLKQIRAALHIARLRLEEPELEVVQFG